MLNNTHIFIVLVTSTIVEKCVPFHYQKPTTGNLESRFGQTKLISSQQKVKKLYQSLII